MTRSVGVVGTGMLGSAVSLRLAHSGFEVFAYNRTAQRALPLQAAGCKILESPAAVARASDLVLTVVRDGEAVRSVSFGDGGIVHGCGPGSVVADMSTILPADSQDISEQFSGCGTRWLAAPVMGGPDAAAAGRLVMMADGDRAALDSVRDVFDALCERVHYLGEGGAAHATKLCMNLQIASLAVSLSEGISLARILKVSPESFLEVLNSTYFGTGMSRRKAFKMVKSEYPATFTLENLTKDLRLMRDAAASAGANLGLTDALLRAYEGALSSGLGELDYTGILEFVGRRAGAAGGS